VHFRYKTVFPYLPREAVCRQTWAKVADSMVILFRSGDHPAVPRKFTSGVVRAQVMGSGVVLRRVPGEDGDSKNKDRLVVTILSHCDTLGLLPKSSLLSLGRQQSMMLSTAKPLLDETPVAEKIAVFAKDESGFCMVQ